MFLFQSLAAKRNAGVSSAMVARQSLNDEELVSRQIMDILVLLCKKVSISVLFLKKYFLASDIGGSVYIYFQNL